MREITARPNSIVNRTFELFELLSKSRNGMNANEICGALEITKATGYSLLRSCLDAGFVNRDSVTGNFVLGYRFFEYCVYYQNRSPILPSAVQVCDRLSKELGICCDLYVRQGEKAALLVIRNQEGNSLEWHVAEPMWAFAPGRILLSGLSKAELDKILKTEREPFNDNTITDSAKLREIIADAKIRGYCVDHHEVDRDSVFIAAPVSDDSGAVAASLCFQVDEKAWEENGEKLIDRLREEASELSREMNRKAFFV